MRTTSIALVINMASEKDLPPPPFGDNMGSKAFPQQPAAISGGFGFRTHFACLTINESDKLRFINFPPDVNSDLTRVVEASWPEGIHEPRRYGAAHEIKCHGYPWRTSHSGKDSSRRLLRRVFEELYDRGWVLQMAVDISNKIGDKGSRIPSRRHGKMRS